MKTAISKNDSLLAVKTTGLKKLQFLIQQEWFLICLLVVISLFLRLYRLSYPALLGDEILSLMSANFDLKPRMAFPPLHANLIKIFITLFERDVFYIRLPGTLLGAFAVLYQYYIGKLLFDRRIAFLSALFMSLSIFHIFSSREAHSYGVYTFFASASFYFFLQVLYKEYRFRTVLLYIFSVTGVLYNHYVGVTLCMTQAAIVLVYLLDQGIIKKNFLRFKSLFKQFAISGVSVILLTYPLHEDFFKTMNWGTAGTKTHLNIDFDFIYDVLSKQTFGNGFGFWLFTVIFIIGMVYIFKISLSKGLFILFWLVFPYLIFVIWGTSFFFHTKRLIFTLNPLYTIFAVGLAGIISATANHRKVLYFVFGTFIIIWSYRMIPIYEDYYRMKSHYADYKAATDWMKQNLDFGTSVLIEQPTVLNFIYAYYVVPNVEFSHVGWINDGRDIPKLRELTKQQLQKYPDTVFYYNSVASEAYGYWEWPYKHFKHHVSFSDEPRARLIKKGFFGKTATITETIFYNQKKRPDTRKLDYKYLPNDGILPPTAYRAEYSATRIPEVMKAGKPYKIKVEITNRSDVKWEIISSWRHRIKLSYHWLSESGGDVRFENNRAMIKQDLAPNEKTVVEIFVEAPENFKGNYILEFDMLQEQISWFNWQKSKTLRTKVLVN
jgi:hypothetical protein